MRTIQLNDSRIFEITAKVLNNGGLVMHPTETCYGLAVDVFNEEAVKKLYSFKEMSMDKPVSILVDSLEMAYKYGDFSVKAKELAAKYWPGPLSIVVPRTSFLPEFLNKGEEYVSIRYSSDLFCMEMVKAFGKPVTTTSANKTGSPQLYEVSLDSFGNDKEILDLVVDGGKIVENKPSTIIKIVGEEMTVLRQGELIV